MILRLLIFVCLCASVAAQEPLFQTISSLNGLPTNTVYNVIQDKRQFVWLGTEKGLVRYDGNRFQVIANTQSRSAGISDLWFDAKGNLRCQNFSGQHFVLQGDSLVLENTFPTSGNYAPVLHVTNGSNYIACFNNLFVINGKTDTIHFTNEIYTAFQFKEDVFTFDSTHSFCLTKDVQPSRIPFSLNGETVFFSVNVDGRLLIFPRSKPAGVCYQFFPEFKQFSYQLPSATILCVKVIDEQIFIGTSEGLFVFDANLSPLSIHQPLLKNKRVSDVMRDANGAIWISTLDDGMFRFNCWNCSNFSVGEAVSAIAFGARVGDVFVGTVSGKVFSWNEGNRLDKVFQFDSRQKVVSLKYNLISGELLVAGDVLAMKHKNGAVENFPYAVKDIFNGGIDSFLLSRTGAATWLVKHKNLKERQSAAGTSNSKWKKEDVSTPFNNNLRVKSSVLEQKSGTIFSGTSVGLLSIASNGIVEVKDSGTSIAASMLSLIGDTLIVASNRGLLMMYNRKIIKRWNAQNSIIPNALKIVRVFRRDVWVTSGDKLYRLMLDKQEVQCFDVVNGFEISDLAVYDGKCYLATDAGFTVFPYNKNRISNPPLQLHLESFSSDKRKLNFENKVLLRYDENNLRIDFSVPFFGSKEDVKIFYRVNAEEWRTTEEAQRGLSFLSLQPSNYMVEIFARTSDGRVSEIQKVDFTIRPPFWKTWWFYLLSLLLVAMIGYAFYSYRIKLIEEKNRLQQQKIELESKLRDSILASVKAQMNPHFIFNALNTIQSFIYLNDKQNATSYLGKFSQLTRTILEMSNKNSVSLQEEIDTIMLYLELEKMRFDESLNFTLEVSPEVNPSAVRIPSMIIQPYIENAIKHGLLHKKGEQWLKCSFRLKEGMLSVIVDDNGIGRARSAALNKIKSNKHQSFATQANEKRLDALNRGNSGTVSVHYIDKISVNGEAEGTTVELMIALMDE